MHGGIPKQESLKIFFLQGQNLVSSQSQAGLEFVYLLSVQNEDFKWLEFTHCSLIYLFYRHLNFPSCLLGN